MQVPILTYHSLDDSGSAVSVPPETLRQHLERLHAAGYTALPLSDALARLTQSTPGRQRIPTRERIVALTFDDGYAAVHQHALPLLASYGWCATVFPISDYVGGSNRWLGQPTSIPSARLLSWTELAELAGAGWEIGAHSRTHPDLTLLTDNALADEVLSAKEALEDRLGRVVQVFAYPYGRHDRRVQACVRAAYMAACTTVMDVASTAGDPYALARLDMWYFSRSAYRLLASPLMGPYVALCRTARRGRASVAGVAAARRAIHRLSLHRRAAR